LFIIFYILGIHFQKITLLLKIIIKI